MKHILTIVLLLPALAWGQTFTESMQAAGAAVEARVTAAEQAAAAATARANEVMQALQVETADIAAINVSTQRLADEMALLRTEVAAFRARLDKLEAAPAVRMQSITVAVPATP